MIYQNPLIIVADICNTWVNQFVTEFIIYIQYIYNISYYIQNTLYNTSFLQQLGTKFQQISRVYTLNHDTIYNI